MTLKKLSALTLSATLVLGLGSISTPASAATLDTVRPAAGLTAIRAVAKPTIRVAYGDRSLTVDWSAVPGAASYTLQYSTKKSFSSSKKVAVGTDTFRVIKGLKNDTFYYVRLIVVDVYGTKTLSAAVKAEPDDGYPDLVTAKVVSAGENKIKVTWTGLGRATKIAVIAGSDSVVTKRSWHSAWYPTTTRSITLTVPTKYREDLGSGSGQPIFVKVAVYNDLGASDSLPTVSSVSKSYRLSYAGAYAYAGAVKPTGDRVRVATYNVKSFAATEGQNGLEWKDRRDKIARTIVASNADLVAAQELNASYVDERKTTFQWQDLLNQISDNGYAIAGSPQKQALGTKNGAHLFYKPSELRLLDQGYLSTKKLGIDWPNSVPEQFVSWGKFRSATGGTFFAVSMHLPPGDYQSLRIREAIAVNKILTERANGLPIVLMGDFNSSVVDTKAPNRELRERGYYDTKSAITFSGEHWNSVNSRNSASGFPDKPYRYKYPAPRIDYIMIKNAPGAFKYYNQLKLDSSGNLISGYQGSDHNLQWADIGIPIS